MFLDAFSRKEKFAFLPLAKKVMLADNKIEEEEQNLFSLYLQEMQLKENEVEYLTEEAAYAVFQESSEIVRRQTLIELISLSMCDNQFDAAEKSTIETIAQHLNVSNSVLSHMTGCVTELLDIYKKLNEIIAEGRSCLS